MQHGVAGVSKEVSVLVTMLGLLYGCTATKGDSGECLPSCPERETTYTASDVPCGSDTDNPMEASCTVVEECGQTIYCRAEGF